MILVAVGTHAAPFDRLLRAVDHLSASGIVVSKDVVIQAGTSSYQCRGTRQFSFCTRLEFDQLIDDARLLICHGGIGTILPALRRAKHVIAIPRLRQYGEHNNDHQVDICMELKRQRAIFTSPCAEDLEVLFGFDKSALIPFDSVCSLQAQIGAELLAFESKLQRGSHP